jgi:2-polyprenyl-3-methyl-5-hydroxy-6-metoxy-1,4-benzoquinol methylase
VTDSHTSAVIAAQDAGHAEGHDYDKGSPHLRHRTLREMVEQRLQALVRGTIAERGTCEVLEVGAGHGTFTRCLLEAGASVTVTEASSASADRLRATFGDRIEVVHDATGEDILRSERQWDLAVMTAVLHHIPDYLGFLDRLALLVRPGGNLFTVADPLYYPRMPQRTHRTVRAFYLAWRACQGDFRVGLATRLRRMRGVYDDTNPSDLVEYHVVRDGVDEQAIRALLAPHFADVEVFSYWASQAPVFQWVGERTSMVCDFGIQATRRVAPPQAEG